MANVWQLTQRQESIDTYLRACANLYGHITPKQFLIIFNKYNQPRLLKSELMQYAHKLNRQAKNYYIYTNAIINTTVKHEVIDKIIYYQEGKKYYVPEKDELLKWTEERYFPITPQSEELKDTFLNKFKVTSLAIGSLMYELFHSILIDERMQAQSDIMDKYHVFDKCTVADYNKFLSKVYIEYVNNTRHWANCGFTPMEMLKLNL